MLSNLSTYHFSRLDPQQLPGAAAAAAIAYDNSTRSLYSAMSQEVSIFRIFSNGVRYRFLDFATVTYMSVMESRALVFVATAYAIHAYRLTSTHSKTYVATVVQRYIRILGYTPA